MEINVFMVCKVVPDQLTLQYVAQITGRIMCTISKFMRCAITGYSAGWLELTNRLVLASHNARMKYRKLVDKFS